MGLTYNAAVGAANPLANILAIAASSDNGQGSLALSLQHRFGRNWTAGISAATNGSQTLISAGARVGW